MSARDPMPGGERGIRIKVDVYGVPRDECDTVRSRLEAAIAETAYGAVTSVECFSAHSRMCDADRSPGAHTMIHSTYPQERVLAPVLKALRDIVKCRVFFSDIRELTLPAAEQPVSSRCPEDAVAGRI